jgi:hypothetical protein
VLDPVEESFDLIPLAVEMRAEADRITPIPAGRDVRPAATRTHEPSYLGRVVSLVGKNHPAAWQTFKQSACRQAVMLLTAGDCDVERQTIGVDYSVDFGRQPSAGASKFFVGAILSATRVLMGADYRAVDHLHLSIVPMRDGSQDTIPDACATPSNEPVVAGGVRSIAFGQITPRRS